MNSREYELHILKRVINEFLDTQVPANQDGLNLLIHQAGDLVWRIATKIYIESGHKIELVMVRDIIISRIAPLKLYVIDQQEKEERQRKIEEDRQRELFLQRQIQEERRQKIEEDRQRELFLQRQIQEERQRKIEEEERLKYNSIKQGLIKKISSSNINFLIKEQDYHNYIDVFLKLQNVIVEHLDVEPNIVTLESSFYCDLHVDNFDIIELIMKFEEEFDLEILDKDAELIHTIKDINNFLYEKLFPY